MNNISEKTKHCIGQAYNATMLQYSGDTRKKLLGKILTGIVGCNTYFSCTKPNIALLSESVFSDPLFRDFLLNLTTRFFFHYDDDKKQLCNYLANSLFIDTDSLVPNEISSRLPEFKFIEESITSNGWLCVYMILAIHCDVCTAEESKKQ